MDTRLYSTINPPFSETPAEPVFACTECAGPTAFSIGYPLVKTDPLERENDGTPGSTVSVYLRSPKSIPAL